MNGSAPALAWNDANQQLLVAEFARIKARLGGAGELQPGESGAEPSLQALRESMPAPAAIDHLAACFGLSAFERDILLLCAAGEMDGAFASLYAAAVPAARAQQPSFGLALASLADPHWSALAPIGPLRRWRLLDIDDAAGVAQARLRIDERILHFLAGLNYLDTRLRGLLRPATIAAVMAPAHRAVCQAVSDALDLAEAGECPLLWLVGDDAPAQVDVAAAASAARGLLLHVMRAEDVPGGHAELDALATLWEREAVLLGGALLIECGSDPLPRAASQLASQLHGLVFISARQGELLDRPGLRFSIDKPDAAEQKQLWRQALGQEAGRIGASLDSIASQFRLSARSIALQGRQLGAALAASAHPDRLLWSACRLQCQSKLDQLAQRIDLAATWDDLVLDEPQKAILRQIGTHMKNRLTVHLDWGFAGQGGRGLGIAALFAGESGTGKTMAAEVLANELQLDLYRIDLSFMVSKYIGETEKNLRRVFDAAEESGAILLFDEADALFGKRSEVKDSHDRYANIEVSYLLQRMETYRGLAILTSNLKAAMDTAFQRRLQFVVQFPFPDSALREAIWRRAFPSRTPLSGIDFSRLARLSVAGGTIRNIALNAAFLAAEAAEPVSMAHLLRAAHHDAAKRERPLADAETRGWV